jgi:hypothetical protein
MERSKRDRTRAVGTEQAIEQRGLVEALGMTIASLEEAAPRGVRDVDGRLTGWLVRHAASAVLVRPDFYVFGSADGAEAVPALLDDLRAKLEINSTPRLQEAA